ncbi:hypothetical protein ACLB2K_025020 [Fragaria x ananassa]
MPINRPATDLQTWVAAANLLIIDLLGLDEFLEIKGYVISFLKEHGKEVYIEVRGAYIDTMNKTVTSGRKRGRSETEGNSVQCAQSTDEGENHDVSQKYMVDVCFKPFILQQMGKLWRSWKSELSTEIRKILELKSTKTERTNLIAKLKPHDVSLPEWEQFVQQRMSDKWLAKSLKMREIRAKQTLTHTLSRKGYARKEDEHNKEHPDKPLTKPQLWIEAHVSKKKTSEANAAKIV